MAIDVRKVIDNSAQLLARVQEMTNSDVLVGIPAAKTTRKDAGPTNAMLAFVHEYGSPAKNIPARPFLFPGIRKVRSQTVALFKQGGQDAILGKAKIDVVLNKIGLIARNSVVNEITDPEPPFVPLKPATIRARLRRTAAGRRKIKQLAKKGIPLTVWAEAIDPASGSANIHPLIDTGQLRAAISYVVRKG